MFDHVKLTLKDKRKKSLGQEPDDRPNDRAVKERPGTPAP